MELYVGGSFQGKKSYVDNKYSNIRKLKWLDGKICKSREDILGSIDDYDAVYDYQEVIKKELRDDLVPEDELKCLLDKKPDIIIVCDEVGCGVIPMAKEDRIYREAVGRCMCMAAARADSVTRIICGIGQVIKG